MPDDGAMEDIMRSLDVPIYTSDGTAAASYPWEHSPLDGTMFDTRKGTGVYPPPLRILPDASGVWVKDPTRKPPPRGGIYHLTNEDLHDIRMIVRDELQRALGIVLQENT